MERGISDQVIIVSEYDPLSAAGVERLKGTMGDHLSFDRTWILLNKMLPEFVKSFSEFLSVARYLPPVPWTAEVVRAYAKRRLALDFESPNQFTLAIMQTLQSLLGEDDAKKLTEWAEERTAALKQPIEVQYADLEKELHALYTMSSELTRRRRLMELSTIGIAIFVGLIGAGMFLLKSELFSTPVIVIIGGTLVALMGLVASGVFEGRSGARQVEGARLTRQIDVVSGRLRQLEVLKSAGLADIVNAGNVGAPPR
jgi:hypothetical protein